MTKILLIAIFLSVSAGVAYLALSDVPAPTQAVVKPIPTEPFFTR